MRIARIFLVSLFAGLAPAVMAQLNWNSWNNGQSIGSFFGLAATATEAVAVGIDGRIATRSKATGQWLIQTFSGDADFRAVVRGNGQYVAVREGGGIMTSSDGATWTARTSPTTADLRAIIWDGQRFIAAGQNGAIVTSPDGVAWTLRDSGSTIFFNALAYSGSRYVAAGGFGLRVSVDGVAWTAPPNPPPSLSFEAATWTGSRFLIGGLGSNTTATVYGSTDGLSWAVSDSTNKYNVEAALTVGGFTYLAGSVPTSGNGFVRRSSDGTTWTDEYPSGSGAAFNALAHDGRFLIGAGFNHNVQAADVTGEAVSFTAHPQSQTVDLGGAATFSCGVAGATPYSYQWRRNGVVIAGATNQSLALSDISFSDGGYYDVVVSNAVSSLASNTASLQVRYPAASAVLVNLSARLSVPAEGVTAYFRIDGGNSKQVLIRAVGPMLAQFGFGGAIADPQLVLRDSSGALIAGNDNWGGGSELATAFTNVGAFGLSAGSKDSALLANLAPGFYSLFVNGVGASTGECLIEIYEADALSRTAIFSYLALRGRANNNLITGVVLSGSNPGTLVVRAVGPSLEENGALSDPSLTLSGITQNDNWSDSANASTIASIIAQFGAISFATDSRDSALMATVPPGSYTAQVSGVGGSSGVVQVEVFDATVNAGGRLPFVLNPPVSQSVSAGQTVTLSVAAGGTGPLSYRWRRNGAVLPGATNASLSFNAVAGVAGDYDVVVANSAGSVTTPTVSLTVQTPLPPTITSATGSGSIPAGSSTVFSVSVTSSAPWSYQWRKNGVAIAGATIATLALAGVTAADSGAYDVVVTNAGGSVTSQTLNLDVTPAVPPVITVQPSGGTLNETNVASFRVMVSGSPPLSYQWRKNGVVLSGDTNSSYILGPVNTASAGTYDVVVSNVGGTVTSAAVELAVIPAGVIITTQPVNVAAYLGAAASLSVTANGVPSAPSYQWRKNGVAIAGATLAIYAVTAAQVTDAGTYDVVVSNGFASATSVAVSMTVSDSAPLILTQPVGATLAVGGAVTFSVAVAGSHPLTYQWRRNGLSLAGATGASLLITNAQTYNAGDYEVIVANSAGIVTSAGARLNVVPRVVSYSARLVIGPEGASGVFTIEGTASKTLLLRAVGPGLAPFGITGLMSDPQLAIFGPNGNLVAVNDDWNVAENVEAIVAATAAVGAFALNVGSHDSAVLRSFAPGTYTARASVANGVGGVAYLEIYDADLATGPISTIPFVAVRGRVAPGSGIVVGGMGSNGRGQRSYLLRALGPALGLPNAVSDPSFLVVRDNALVGMNDNWGSVPAEAVETATAVARLGLSSLPAGSKDAALVLTGNIHAGPHTVQVSSPEGPGGIVLLELHDLDSTRPTHLAPAIVSPPVAQTVAAGSPLTLKVVAYGTGPLAYQWLKDSVPVSGATAATYEVGSATGAQAGSYEVVVTNATGTARSLPALVTLQSGPGGSAATQRVVGDGYVAGGTATISNTLTFTGSPDSLGWSVVLPVGWSFVSDGGASGEVKPAAGATGSLEWAWSIVPTSPVTFTYTVHVPPGEFGTKTLVTSGIIRQSGDVQVIAATPSPLSVAAVARYHSADTNVDGRISLLELTRVIELYNTRNGTTRTGCYMLQPGTEDGYAADASRASGAVVNFGAYYAGDSNRDGKLSLLELTRMIELYNFRNGTTRTGQYRAQAGTEDGFAPGP